MFVVTWIRRVEPLQDANLLLGRLAHHIVAPYNLDSHWVVPMLAILSLDNIGDSIRKSVIKGHMDFKEA